MAMSPAYWSYYKSLGTTPFTNDSGGDPLWSNFNPTSAAAYGLSPQEIIAMAQKAGLGNSAGNGAVPAAQNVFSSDWFRGLDPSTQQQLLESYKASHQDNGWGAFLGALGVAAAPFALGSALGTLGSGAGTAAGSTAMDLGGIGGAAGADAAAALPTALGGAGIATGAGAALSSGGGLGAIGDGLGALGGGLKSLFGTNGGLGSSILGTAFNSAPFLLALDQANKESNTLGGTTSQMQDLLNSIKGNQSPYINAVTQPLEQQYATNRYSMQNDMANRGILGSSLADSTLGNYDRLANSAISDARSKALNSSYGLQGDILNNIYTAQNKNILNRNLLLGAGLNASGQLFNSGGGNSLASSIYKSLGLG